MIYIVNWIRKMYRQNMEGIWLNEFSIAKQFLYYLIQYFVLLNVIWANEKSSELNNFALKLCIKCIKNVLNVQKSDQKRFAALFKN